MTGSEKFRKVMREFKNKELVSGGSGDIVTKRDQAVAIAFSEAKKVDSSFGRYKDGGKIYAIGGDVIKKKYLAEDYFLMGDNYEFMFDNKGSAERMASDYGVSIIEDGGNFYVPIGKKIMKDGGELEGAIKNLKGALKEAGDKRRKDDDKYREKSKNLLKEMDDKGRIDEAKFKKIIGDKNPSRITPVKVSGMKFEKCLFTPHYKLKN